MEASFTSYAISYAADDIVEIVSYVNMFDTVTATDLEKILIPNVYVYMNTQTSITMLHPCTHSKSQLHFTGELSNTLT